MTYICLPESPCPSMRWHVGSWCHSVWLQCLFRVTICAPPPEPKQSPFCPTFSGHLSVSCWPQEVSSCINCELQMWTEQGDTGKCGTRKSCSQLPLCESVEQYISWRCFLVHWPCGRSGLTLNYLWDSVGVSLLISWFVNNWLISQESFFLIWKYKNGYVSC